VQKHKKSLFFKLKGGGNDFPAPKLKSLSHLRDGVIDVSCPDDIHSSVTATTVIRHVSSVATVLSKSLARWAACLCMVSGPTSFSPYGNISKIIVRGLRYSCLLN